MRSLDISLEQVSLLKGEVAYLHQNKYGPSGSYMLGEPIRISLSAPRLIGIVDARILLFDESGKELRIIEGVWSKMDSGNDLYVFSLTPSLSVGLYFYEIRLSSSAGTVYARPAGCGVGFTHRRPDDRFQLTVSNFLYEKPDHMYGGVIYHVFVDRFARSTQWRKKRAPTTSIDWSDGIPEYPEYPGAPLKNTTLYGGDLYGIIEKLPYIRSLGVNAIYLSPIFEAASNHKYDTGDYMKVDPSFGGGAALKDLISESEKYGIIIILDGVFNHTGDDSKYFNRYGRYPSVGAYQSKASPYYSWYDFKDHPDAYTSWWGIEILPRINPDENTCREFFVGKNGVVDHYAKMGIGGFRLDVVDELSDDFVASIKRTLNDSNRHSILYGEVWEDASNKLAYGKRKQYYLGAELDGVMNYPLRSGIIDYILNQKTDKLLYALTDVMYNAPKRIRDTQMNLLGTHDTERILTVLGGRSSEGMSNAYLRTVRMSEGERNIAIARLKLAYTILATLPGVPSIFYGDEAGLEGYHDPFNRMPYPWGKENSELLAHYRLLGKIRRSHAVYRDGEYSLKILSEDCLIFTRRKGSAMYVTVANNSAEPLNLHFSKKAKRLLHPRATDISPFESEIFVTSIGSEINYKKQI